MSLATTSLDRNQQWCVLFRSAGSSPDSTWPTLECRNIQNRCSHLTHLHQMVRSLQTTYIFDYATSDRSKCKNCKGTIQLHELRVGCHSPLNGGWNMHVSCWDGPPKNPTKGRNATTLERVRGFDTITDDRHRDVLRRMAAGELYQHVDLRGMLFDPTKPRPASSGSGAGAAPLLAPATASAVAAVAPAPAAAAKRAPRAKATKAPGSTAAGKVRVD